MADELERQAAIQPEADVSTDAEAEQVFNQAGTQAADMAKRRELGGVEPAPAPSPAPAPVKAPADDDAPPADAKPPAAPAKPATDAVPADGTPPADAKPDPLALAEKRGRDLQEQADRELIAKKAAEERRVEQERAQQAATPRAATVEQIRDFASKAVEKATFKGDDGQDMTAGDVLAEIEAMITPRAYDYLLQTMNALAAAHAGQLAGQVNALAAERAQQQQAEQHEDFIASLESGEWSGKNASFKDQKADELAHPHIRAIEADPAFWKFVDEQSEWVKNGVNAGDPEAVHHVLRKWEDLKGLSKAPAPEPPQLRKAREERQHSDQVHTQTIRGNRGGSGPSAAPSDDIETEEDAQKEFEAASKRAQAAGMR